MDHLVSGFVHERFPLISEACRRAGLDLARDRVPVGPAAHYVMGGVHTDLDARTSIPGLYAAGEVACTGVHGANRLASNSLLEGLVFGARAGRAMRSAHVETWPAGSSRAAVVPDGFAQSGMPGRTLDAADVQDLMWRHVGLFRDRAALAGALDVLEPAWRALDAKFSAAEALHAAEWHSASLILVGRLIARAALRREESRGGHFRADYPQRDDIHWKRRVFEARDGTAGGR
jgi:L-aspartate oxidase